MRFFSVIIPAFNEERVIRLCLEGLMEQDYPPDSFEIVVVDNGSSDGTVDVCRAFTSKVRVAPVLTVAAMRNLGVREALGDALAFLDADCVPAPDWLTQADLALTAEECVTGSKYDVPERAGWIERAWFSQKPVGRREVAYINSGNLVTTAEIFRRAGGFDESLTTGEDYEFCQRARAIARIVSDDRIRVTHLGNPKRLGDFLKREIWHGLGAFGALKHKMLDLPLLGTLAFALLTALQCLGMLAWLAGRGSLVLAVATAVLLGLLATTAAYRQRFRIDPIQTLQLAALYYVYYLGRSISLVYIVTGRTYVRKKQTG